MDISQQRLVLIDGSGFIFRAYHKLPPLTRHDGLPIGAVYGFTAMLLKLREEMQSSHMVVVFDAKGDNFRHQLFPQYKANRPPAPEDLIPQFPYCRKAATALNIEIIEQVGAEADDIIATYVRMSEIGNMPVCIVSSDKDLMQMLARPNVELFDPLKNTYINHDDVLKKFGVVASQVAEVQAIMGDNVDNIAGVKGIGAKGAADLINQFGTIENMLNRINEISKNKQRELIETQRAELLISKQLVSLKEDCEDLPAISSLTTRPLDNKIFSDFCDEMGFKTLRRRVETLTNSSSNNSAVTPKQQVNKDYHLVQDMAELTLIIAEIKQYGLVAFDVETTSLDAMQAELVGISLCYKAGLAYYIPLTHQFAEGLFHQTNNSSDNLIENHNYQLPTNQVIEALQPILSSADIIKIGHNIKYDMQIMQRYGAPINGIHDTMLLSYCLRAGLTQHNMDKVAEDALQVQTIKYNDVVGSGKAQKCFNEVSLKAALDYAAEDADITLQLYHHLRAELLALKLASLYERIERPMPSVVQMMEANGVRIDALYLNELSKQFASDMQILEKDIFESAGFEFNIASPKQIGEVLFEKLQLKGGKKSGKTGAYVTDAETLEELAIQHPLPAKILEWRQLAKLRSTYTESLPKQINPTTGRVHTSYSLASTTTGRLSSNEPNLQNIPIRTQQGRLIRQAFIPANGFKLMSADYSQIELRLLAHIADITPLKQAFAEGVDIHTVTASQVFGVPQDQVDFELRRKAKTINFGIIYGISAHGLSMRLGIPRSLAAEYIDLYFKQYSGIAEYMSQCRSNAKQYGYVETLWGRRCHLPMINSKIGTQRAFAERAAINAPLQGSAADIIKKAMIAVHNLLQSEQTKSRMLLQVHDELVFEIAHDENWLIDKIKLAMQNVAHLSVPLLVETGIGDSWATAH
jgi:DNA polymerase I